MCLAENLNAGRGKCVVGVVGLRVGFMWSTMTFCPKGRSSSFTSSQNFNHSHEMMESGDELAAVDVSSDNDEHPACLTGFSSVAAVRFRSLNYCKLVCRLPVVASTVHPLLQCLKVASAPLLQTKVALSPRASSKLHGLMAYCVGPWPIQITIKKL